MGDEALQAMAADQAPGNPDLPQASNGYGRTAESQLVERARAGDGEAYATLVQTCAPKVYGMLYHLANQDADTAAELLQEAFARAWERLDRFDGRSAFGTWLYRLARNRAIDLMARKRPLAVDPAGMAEAMGGGVDDEAVEKAELRQLVRTALDRLSPEHRELLIMRDYAGHDYASIADTLAVPVGTVKSRIARARAALRAELDGHISAEDLS